MLKLAGVALSVLLLSVVGVLPYHADAQTQKYLSYENKQYGFSIKYPSNWQKAEVLTKSSVFPNVLDIVTFSTPSELTSYGVSLIKDDTTFTGLSGQKFLDKVKEKFVDPICRRAPAGVTCSTELAQQTTLTHQNGYSGYLVIFGINVSSDQESIESGVVLGFYPDGNDIWIIAAASSSGDEFQRYTNELATIGSSFKIFNYDGEQTTTSQPSTVAKSSVGTLQLNSGNFAVSKYKPAELIVSGQINNPLQGVPLILKIIKPDKTSEEQNILVTKDGNFRAPIKIEGTWPAGSYQISAKYGTQNLGTVSFQVNTGDAKTTTPTTQKQTTTTPQSKKYLSYENKKYGFSLKYPSDLKKEETLTESDEPFPNSISIVSFTTPSELSTLGVALIKDDTIFKGLSGQKFLDKMKNEFESRTCSAVTDPTLTCSMEVGIEGSDTNQNGHVVYTAAYAFTVSDNQDSQKIIIFITMFPNGNDVWVLGLVTVPGETYKGIGEETGKMADTFKISNYKGEQKSSSSTKPSTTQTTPLNQKQFSLNVKAIQENDLVTITITSPKDSSSDVYGIKLTTTTGKIKNYVKVNGWDHKRISDNTVSYQTKSYPLGQSDVIKIKLKVDTKKPEITWNAYSKDQKSLGTGKVKP